MGIKGKKFEFAILVLALIVVGGLGYLLKGPARMIVADGEPEVIYEMPRPKASFLAGFFTLADREVFRRYVNPFAIKKSDSKKSTTAKKDSSTKKAANPASNSASTKKAAGQIKTETKVSPSPTRKKVDIQVVGADSPQGLLNDDIETNTVVTVPQFEESIARKISPSNTAQGQTILGGSQWRALILAQPNKANMDKLIQAYGAKEIDEVSYYMIVGDLFRDNKPEVQALGLHGVRALFDSKSFAVTAQYYDQLAPSVQEKAHSYLLSYAVNPRLPILMISLQSSNPEVVVTAAQVILAGYQKAKEGVSPVTNPRSTRGDVNTNSVVSYSKFLPVFQQLAQSPDSVIAGLASAALNQMQTAVASL